jgi:hypothetical protein
MGPRPKIAPTIHGATHARGATLLGVMSTTATRIDVLLVGLPGFYEELLRREFGRDAGVQVTRMAELATGPEPPSLALDAVIVVGMSASSLRRATELTGRISGVVGMLAVTDDEPRGDAYLVSPVGRNVSPQELAQVIRDVASGARPSPVQV